MKKWIYTKQWSPTFTYANSALGKQCPMKINGNNCLEDNSLRYKSQSFRKDPTDLQTKWSKGITPFGCRLWICRRALKIDGVVSLSCYFRFSGSTMVLSWNVHCIYMCKRTTTDIYVRLQTDNLFSERGYDKSRIDEWRGLLKSRIKLCVSLFRIHPSFPILRRVCFSCKWKNYGSIRLYRRLSVKILTSTGWKSPREIFVVLRRFPILF